MMTMPDLPLIEVPACKQGDTMAVLITGDGGWTRINREIARHLAEAGVSVVGLSAPRYFWRRREPDAAARDLEKIMRHYGAAWGRGRVILIGYSRGAGVLPFIFNRLPAAARERVTLTVLIGLTAGIDFRIHLRDFLGLRFEVDRFHVLPELEKMRGHPLLCIYGLHENGTVGRRLDPTLTRILAMPDGHHFGGHTREIAEAILDRAGIAPVAPVTPPGARS
jgi:type IV secretory pathway VirJ component